MPAASLSAKEVPRSAPVLEGIPDEVPNEHGVEAELGERSREADHREGEIEDSESRRGKVARDRGERHHGHRAAHEALPHEPRDEMGRAALGLRAHASIQAATRFPAVSAPMAVMQRGSGNLQ